MQQLCEPYRIRYIVLSRLGEVGVKAGSAGIVQAGKAPGVLLPLVEVLVGVCMCVLSFLAASRSCLPVLDPLSLVVGWGQVSLQSADAQEQVEGLLTENNALRTSLAALEQVQDTWEPMLIPP